MGANLARNAARNGATVAVYNRTTEKTDAFVKSYASEGTFVACHTLKDMMKALPAPRVVVLMVKAGQPVDDMIDELTPMLAKGDIIVDAGNSLYRDTERREKALSAKNLHFVGMGVSGGEEGALLGPSMMPGGSNESYNVLKPLVEKMSANDGDGGKCVSHIGPGGAGHFVKMVHNGIEYGIMQIIAECYDVLRSIGGYDHAQLAETFESWNMLPELQSFLLEITGKIFHVKDAESGKFTLDIIQDAAGQKGTGKWTTETAMNYGVAIPTINAAVDARILSGSIELRAEHAKFPFSIDIHDPLPRPQKLRALVAATMELSVICAYLQGFELMRVADKAEGWKLNLSEIARIWKGGCIIRSTFLKTLEQAYSTEKSLAQAGWEAVHTRFSGERQLDWRQVVEIGVSRGIPMPAVSASLSYYDTLLRKRLPQNLIQAQRDFFGAHTYQRTDKPGTFHTKWEA